MRLSAHDASFLYTETASGPMHGVGITQIDGDLSHEEYLAFVASRIHLVPRLRQRLVFVPGNIAHPKWVDDPYFDLSYHVRKHDVPEGTTMDEAVEIALQLGRPLLDRSKPLWMTYVIENVEGNTLLIQFSHHAMIDGASSVEMATLMVDFEPDAPTPEPPAEAWAPAPLQSPWELYLEAQAEALGNSTQSPKAVDPELRMKGYAVLNRLSTQPVMQLPFNASMVGPDRSLAWATYDMSAFKKIRKPLGGTINDIVLGVVTEGVARYLDELGEQTAGRTMRLMVPVDVREEGDTELGNKVSGLFPTLSAAPLGMSERYAEVRKEMDHLKEEREADALQAWNDSLPEAPPVAMTGTLGVGTPLDPTAFAARFPAPVLPHYGPRPPHFGYNFTCTNVAGIQEQTYIAGHKINWGTGTMMLAGVLGLGVACGSGGGEFSFSFTADPRLIPDVTRIRDHVKAAFAELLDLAASGDQGIAAG